jgi:hypothetical protein
LAVSPEGFGQLAWTLRAAEQAFQFNVIMSRVAEFIGGRGMEELKAVAREALNSFAAISEAAARKLRDRGLSLESLAIVNQATAETVARDMQIRNAARNSDCQRLRYEPTIARIVVIPQSQGASRFAPCR